MSPPADFQRARRPEQREQRRRAILDATEALLAEVPVEDISLRELSRRLGTSKTNVVRYFETREGVLLALLNRARSAWLDELDERLPPGPVHADELVTIWADSLAERPLLCQLWSLLPTVLERNVSAASVRSYKLTDLDHRTRLARLVSERVPALDEATALHLTRIAVVALTGLWPFCTPTPAIVEATSDPRLRESCVEFATAYTDILRITTAGLLARGEGSAAPGA